MRTTTYSVGTRSRANLNASVLLSNFARTFAMIVFRRQFPSIVGDDETFLSAPSSEKTKAAAVVP
jgi:hypothetical protein